MESILSKFKNTHSKSMLIHTKPLKLIFILHIKNTIYAGVGACKAEPIYIYELYK